jgi:hypothetical protein
MDLEKASDESLERLLIQFCDMIQEPSTDKSVFYMRKEKIILERVVKELERRGRTDLIVKHQGQIDEAALRPVLGWSQPPTH